MSCGKGCCPCSKPVREADLLAAFTKWADETHGKSHEVSPLPQHERFASYWKCVKEIVPQFVKMTK